MVKTEQKEKKVNNKVYLMHNLFNNELNMIYD